MVLFGKKKEYEQRIAQLESELAKVEHEKKLLEDEIVAIREKAQGQINEEKELCDRILKSTKEQYESIRRDQEKQFSDALISLRERIYAEKNELSQLSEKEILVRMMLVFSVYEKRLDWIGTQYGELLHNVNEEMTRSVHAESENALNVFRSVNAAMIQSTTSAIEQALETYKSRTTELLDVFVSQSQNMQTEVQSDTEKLRKGISALKSEVKNATEKAINAVKDAVNPYENSILNNKIDEIREVLDGIDDSLDIESMYAISVDIQNIINTINAIQRYLFEDESDINYTLQYQIQEITDSINGGYSYSDNLCEMVETIKSSIEDIQSKLDDARS